jgi:hypothetical protein
MIFEHPSHLGWRRKRADGSRQVRVSGWVPRHEPPDGGQDTCEVPQVEGAKRFGLRNREFEDRHPPTIRQDATDLVERFPEPLDVAQAKRHDYGIDRS